MRSIHAATALVLLAPLDADLRFAPDEGARVEQSYLEATEWELASIQQRLNGQELPVEALTGMRTETVRAVALVDTYGPTRDGRLLSLTRSVERADATSNLALATPMGPLDLTVDAESDLVDEVLEFTWSEEREAYGLELESGHIPATLDRLGVEAAFQGLLGDGDHEPDDRWKVGSRPFVEALCAGGELGLVPTSVPELPGDGVSGRDLIAAARIVLQRRWDTTDGEVEFAWEETLEADGRRLARLTFEGELALGVDLTEELERIANDTGADGGEREDYRAQAAWTLDVEGELRWDLGAGRFHRLELEGEGEASLALAWTDPYGEIEIDARLTTVTELECTAEAVD